MKKLLSLLLVLCLAIGLLPVAALADTNTAKILILATEEMSVTEGGEPAYLKNKEFDAANKADGSTTFKAWTQEKGTADAWNVKFEWPKGGIPTVTLKDAKFDYYDNATETYAYLKQADGSYISTANRTTSDLEGGGETENNLIVSAIMPVLGCNIDLKVVLQGENFVETGSGFIFGDVAVKENQAEAAKGTLTNQYFKNLTVTSVDNGKVVANGGGIGIMAKTGYNLTFENAFVEIETSVRGSNATPIHATQGELTINGGHIKATNPQNVAICSYAGGNVVINGDVTVSHSLTSTAGASGIYAPKGTLTVNGGNIVGFSTNAPILNAGKGTTINGGNLKLTSGYYAVYADKHAGKQSEITINGGTIEIIAERAFYKMPVLGAKVNGYAGANAENADYYEGNMYNKPWVLLSDAPINLPTPTEPSGGATEAPTSGATQPTQAPTQAPTQPAGTTAPTQPAGTTAPTQPAGTTAPTQPAAAEQGSNDTIIWIVAAVVLAAAVAAVVLIVVKRKKA